MADANIEKAQRYLNSMYEHRSEWVDLEVDGITGSLLCQGIIRAFQIQNGISPVTGTVGDKTLNKMRELAEISIMDPNDASNPNVCILQCALFAKGYNAGGITGIYYTTGVNAVKEFQEDANLEVTGVIDWKVWMGLVSTNWFKKASGGDNNIRTIQRQLNADWSDIIGVGPCDGVVSRFTAYAFIAALQAAEGIYTDFMGSLDGTNFGDQTTAKFPTVLKQGQNGEFVKYNKLVQYGLYTNGYDPERFDGIFDATTESMVEDFQKFYALTGIGLVTVGEVNCATMKSLLTSKGDTSRKAKACDCSTVLNAQQAEDIKAAGYNIVGRYLTGTVGGSTRKFITFEEIENIKNAGLKVFPIYQDGGYQLSYFQDLRQGTVDAYTAISAAKRVGVPKGSVIYFSVDFDCYDYQMRQFVVPYFSKVNSVFRSSKNTNKYKVGIYAPRYICTYISNLGYADYSFVADMSSGFSCNLGYPIPENWAYDQFFELNASNGGQFQSSPDFDLDKVAYSGRDTGISNFDDVPYLTPDQLAERNSSVLSDSLVSEYVHNILFPLGFYDVISNVGIEYEKEFTVGTISTQQMLIEVSASILNEFTRNFDNDPITIRLDSNGKLTASCENEIDKLSAELETDIDGVKDVIDGTISNLKEIAVSITTGKIGFKLELDGTYPKFTLIFTSEDIFPESDSVDEEITVELSFTIKPAPGYKVDPVKLAQVSASGIVIIILLTTGALLGPQLALLPEFLTAGGIVLAN